MYIQEKNTIKVSLLFNFLKTSVRSFFVMYEIGLSTHFQDSN